MTLGRFAPDAKKVSQALVVDFLPESHRVRAQTKRQVVPRTFPKPPVVIHTKPTIAVPPRSSTPSPFIEMSSTDMAAADLSNLPKTGDGTDGDSEVVGKGPHGEVLYAAEWARHRPMPNSAAIFRANAPDGFGLIACKTIPGDRVDDCVELDQTPGSHLASAVRQAAWQFRVRPPRRNGVPLVGSWVSIRIDYEHVDHHVGV